MQYSPDGRFLASGDDSGMVRLWDFQDMRAWQRGRVLTFGGPTDTDHSPDEGLALASNWHEADDLAIKVFPANADRASSPKVCQLDTKSYYIAMRWDYKLTPAAWLRSHPVRVMNLRTGLEMEAQPVDWGPSLSTGALMHLSPALAAALNVKPNDEAAAWVPVPIDVSKAATPK